MKVTSRQAVLGLALVVSLLAAFAPEAETGEPANVAEPVARNVPQQSAEAPITGEADLAGRLQRGDVVVSDVDPFRAKSWYVPPPPPPPSPPPKPTAPPLPFRYMGMFEDQGKATVYLVRDEESFAVVQGERFADSYRLDRIDRGVLVISYLPLSVQQTLPIGISE